MRQFDNSMAVEEEADTLDTDEVVLLKQKFTEKRPGAKETDQLQPPETQTLEQPFEALSPIVDADQSRAWLAPMTQSSVPFTLHYTQTQTDILLNSQASPVLNSISPGSWHPPDKYPSLASSRAQPNSTNNSSRKEMDPVDFKLAAATDISATDGLSQFFATTQQTPDAVLRQPYISMRESQERREAEALERCEKNMSYDNSSDLDGLPSQTASQRATRRSRSILGDLHVRNASDDEHDEDTNIEVPATIGRNKGPAAPLTLVPSSPSKIADVHDQPNKEELLTARDLVVRNSQPDRAKSSFENEKVDSVTLQSHCRSFQPLLDAADKNRIRNQKRRKSTESNRDASSDADDTIPNVSYASGNPSKRRRRENNRNKMFHRSSSSDRAPAKVVHTQSTKMQLVPGDRVDQYRAPLKQMNVNKDERLERRGNRLPVTPSSSLSPAPEDLLPNPLPPTQAEKRPHRVFALFKNAKSLYYPASITSIHLQAGTSKKRATMPQVSTASAEIVVSFDDGTTDILKTTQMKRLILAPGETVKYDTETASMTSTVMSLVDHDTHGSVDIYGHSNALVQGNGTPGSLSIPMERIYLSKALFNRLSSPFIDLSASYLQGLLNKNLHTRQGSDVSHRNQPLSLAKKAIFEHHVFALTRLDTSERDELSQLIFAHGGKILDSLSDLFEGAQITDGSSQASPIRQSLGNIDSCFKDAKFACVIAPCYCRNAKYLQALSLGLPCLLPSFVRDSVAEVWCSSSQVILI